MSLVLTKTFCKLLNGDGQHPEYNISKAVIGIYQANISLFTFVVYIENLEI